MELPLSQRPWRTPSALLCAFSECRWGDLAGGISYPSNNDFARSVLINAGMSGNMTYYYERVRNSDLLARGDLLLRKKSLSGEWARNRLLSGGETRRRLDQLSLGDIFTTGPHKGARADIILLKVLKSRGTSR